MPWHDKAHQFHALLKLPCDALGLVWQVYLHVCQGVRFLHGHQAGTQNNFPSIIVDIEDKYYSLFKKKKKEYRSRTENLEKIQGQHQIKCGTCTNIILKVETELKNNSKTILNKAKKHAQG